MMEQKKKITNPAAGAIVMALGIFLFGAFRQFTDKGEVFAFAYLLVSLLIFTMLVRQSLQKGFWRPFLHNPVNSFVIGSWIAGLSVLGQVLLEYLPFLRSFVFVVTIGDTILWTFFLFICVHNFKQLWKRPKIHAVHGVILLSAVATQSLVILWATVFPGLPEFLTLGIFSLGIFFYLNGVFLLLIRYKRESWSIIGDWTNTNCIIHGALSITGLAIVSIHMFSATFVLVYWWMVIIVMAMVEAMEIWRGFVRVKQRGWIQGVFTYHISQWSRNFTFGMFYAFTMVMLDIPKYTTSSFIEIQKVVLTSWAWVVLFTLVVEIVLWIRASITSSASVEA